MPPIPPLTRNLMIVCAVTLLLTKYLLPQLSLWFALWPLGSGAFMPWQPLTYALLHGDLAHLGFNMLGLWMFGSELERLWSRNRYLTFMAACAITAAIAQLLTALLTGSHTPTVGFSGVLYGLLLAYALSFPHRRFDLVGMLPMVLLLLPVPELNLVGIVLYVMLMTNRQAVPIAPIPVPALTMVAIFGGIELLLGLFFRTGIAHFAHLGGMLGGWLMMRYWRDYGGRRRR